VIRLLLTIFCGILSRMLRIRKFGAGGAATTEFAICCPLLVIVITGSLDFSAVLSQYGQLEEAIHDGVRYASTISSLELGTYKGLAAGSSAACPPVGSSALHSMLQNRIAELIRTDSRNIELSTLCIISKVEPSVTDPTRRVLKLEIKINYNSVFPGIGNLPLSVEAMGPVM